MGGSVRPRPGLRLALLLFLAAVTFNHLAYRASATCFFPDGSTADSGHKECRPNSGNATTCCAEGFDCLSNGLCNDPRYATWGRVLRGACTSKDFDGNCTDVCKDLWPQGDEAVWYCGSGNYCCARDDGCCKDDKAEKKNIGEPSIVAVAGKTASVTTSVSSTSSTMTSSATTSTSTPTTTPAPATGGGSSTNPKTIGIAVGVVVGVILILLAALWFLRRRKKARKGQHVMHELSGTSRPTEESANKPETYAFDDKAGGWVAGAGTGRGAGTLYEAHTNNAIEMSAHPEIKEMDNSIGTRLPVPVEEQVILRSPVGSTRRSRFVEVDVEDNNIIKG